MKRFILVLLVVLFALPAMAQIGKVYTSIRSVKEPSQVYELKLRFKRLREIPPEVFTYSNLRKLDLSRNFIDSIPPEIASLTQLEELNLSRNKLREVSASIGQMSKLQLLDLSRNPLLQLSDGLGYLEELKQLILWGTGVHELPPTFVMLNGKLQRIDMRGCVMSEEEIENIRELLPEAEVLWDNTCNCATD